MNNTCTYNNQDDGEMHDGHSYLGQSGDEMSNTSSYSNRGGSRNE